MKCIAIDIVWFLIISITAIIIALLIFSETREKIFNFFYCNLYARLFPNSDCKKEEKSVERVYIDGSSEREILLRFTSLLINCWRDAEINNNFKTHYCYEVRFRNVVDFSFNLSHVAKELKEAYNCRELQVKSFNCGYRDDIIWNAEEINKNSIVFIKYLEENKIEVIDVGK
jgi:hypothetical protein